MRPWRLLLLVLACTWHVDSKGNRTKTSDCLSCGCSTSKNFGDHVDNLGKCGNCGTNLE